MSSLHHQVYQSYIQSMHRFCQYPVLAEGLRQAELGIRVKLLAIGKAAWKMAAVSVNALAERNIKAEGLVLTKPGLSHGGIPGLAILSGGHPLPNENSLASSSRIAAWLKKLSAKDDLVILLSGGSSALFELLPEGFDLADLATEHRLLLHSGKDIAEINRGRTGLSLVKGGRALELTKARRIKVFAVSDVEGNDPQVLGSGPFTPAEPGEKTADGWRYKLGTKQIEYNIVADNQGFRELFAKDLREKGFRVLVEKSFQGCPLPKLANQIKEILRRTRSPRYRLRPPFIKILGGESPLKVSGEGLGGRCSHLALLLVRYLAKEEETALFCFATDGCDNVSSSGGAWSDSNTLAQLKAAGINLAAAIRKCDSYTALKSVNHLLPAPLLATNVNDIHVLSVGYSLQSPCPSRDWEAMDIFDELV
ncbi:MAG TPA: DUF4147 domain-containing protein [Candidatus Cloacimonadota bacterium]|nr:DUF4147 domain-containing protein [Candidatus Cloacimonadota bacterium]